MDHSMTETSVTVERHGKPLKIIFPDDMVQKLVEGSSEENLPNELSRIAGLVLKVISLGTPALRRRVRSVTHSFGRYRR